jgi:hypothetical protein
MRREGTGNDGFNGDTATALIAFLLLEMVSSINMFVKMSMILAQEDSQSWDERVDPWVDLPATDRRLSDRLLVRVPMMHVRAVLDQQLHRRHVVLHHRVHKRCVPVLVELVDLRTRRNQVLGDERPTVLGSSVERACAIEIIALGEDNAVGARVDECDDGLQVVALDGVVDRGHGERSS